MIDTGSQVVEHGGAAGGTIMSGGTVLDTALHPAMTMGSEERRGGRGPVPRSALMLATLQEAPRNEGWAVGGEVTAKPLSLL